MGTVLDSPAVAAWLLERLGAQGTMAVVGNSPDLLTQGHGELIDRHELVLRMNAGMPGPEHREALGERTDILAVGNLTVLNEAPVGFQPGMVWFHKPSTRLGDREWAMLTSVGSVSDKHIPLHRLPPERYPALAEEVGAPPSGGLFVVSELLRHGLCGRLNLFGFSFFGAAGSRESWWHNERPKARIMQSHPHKGSLELAWFKMKGLTDQKPGVYGL